MSMDPNAPANATTDAATNAPANEAVQAIPVDGAAPPAQPDRQETITEPAKLLRIASMVRELLDETRQASLDEAGRTRMTEVYQRAVGELSEVLSPDLKEELGDLAPPLEGVPSESEIRVAQAQLVGWLEGLFHGIQAAMFAQQAAARQQFEELRRRGLPGQEHSMPPGPDGAPGVPDGAPGHEAPRGGTYL